VWSFRVKKKRLKNKKKLKGVENRTWELNNRWIRCMRSTIAR
jgi:hypothetical protein